MRTLQHDAKQRRLIIGLGSGRCGTTTLSTLLDSQEDIQMIHEGAIDGGRHLIAWGDEGAAIDWLRDLEARTQPSTWFGDVGMYFLPCVEAIIEEWPTARFLAIRRDRDETVASFMKKTEGRNHWADHDGSQWRLDERWDRCFPSYTPMPKEIALAKYWEDYYARVAELQNRYPKAIRLWEMEALNNAEKRAEMLSFVGYPTDQARTDGEVHMNAERDPYHRHREPEKTSPKTASGELSKWWRRLRRL